VGLNVLLMCGTLPDSTDFSTLPRFRRSILRVSFTKFLKCFSVIMFYVFLLLCVTVEITLLYLVSLYLLASRLRLP